MAAIRSNEYVIREHVFHSILLVALWLRAHCLPLHRLEWQCHCSMYRYIMHGVHILRVTFFSFYRRWCAERCIVCRIKGHIARIHVFERTKILIELNPRIDKNARARGEKESSMASVSTPLNCNRNCFNCTHSHTQSRIH